MLHPAGRSPTPAIEWRPSAPEARRLAASIRSERLTVVIGSPQTQVTALLIGGVFPLLGRRSVDALGAAPGAEGATVSPFPERRQQQAAPMAEILVLADVSRDRTLAALESRFEAAAMAAGVPRSSFAGGRLAERIEAITERHGGRFLFLLDGFEALLDSADDGPEGALVTELVVMLNRPLAANVLLAVRDGAARAPLQALLARLHGPGASATVMELDDGTDDIDEPEAAASPLRPTVRLATTPEERSEAPSPASDEPAATSGWGESEPGSKWFADSVPPAQPESPPEPIGAPPPWLARPARRRKGRDGAIAATACAALLLLGWGVWPSGGNDAAAPGRDAVTAATPPARVVAIAPAPAPTAEPARPRPPVAAAPATQPMAATASAAAPPAFDLLVEADGERAPRLAVELAAALGSVAPRTVQRSTTTLVGAAAERPRLAIARYDELRGAADTARPGARPIQVLAPLPAEAVYVVVRNDGPLRRLGDLQGRRLNLGAAEGGRATTGRLLYRQMFGAAPPAHASAALGTAAALQALAGNGALDAVLLVGASARAQLAALPAETQRALRLLAVSRDDPASRKAFQLYLPATVDGLGGPPVESLASLGFLVAADAGASARHAVLVRALCGQLDRLQREGDPAWRDVRAGQQLPIALRHLDTRVIETAWAQCTPAPSRPASISLR